eukprot:1039428-Pelagomonas_calceolata.AAC.3
MSDSGAIHLLEWFGSHNVLMCTYLHACSAVNRHQLFADMVFAHAGESAAGDEQQAIQSSRDTLLGRTPARPADLPVYGKQHLALAQ